jgi:TIR domain
VIVLSQASVSSRWVEQELNAALTNQISGKGVVLPLLLEDCELPMLLRDRLYADFRADFDVGFQALLAAFAHEGESAVDVGLSEPTTAAPLSITPAGLRENLQDLFSNRMSRTEVGRLWYAVLETRMEDEMGQRPKSDCVIELLEQAKSRNKLPRLTEEFRKIRPDLADP